MKIKAPLFSRLVCPSRLFRPRQETHEDQKNGSTQLRSVEIQPACGPAGTATPILLQRRHICVEAARLRCLWNISSVSSQKINEILARALAGGPRGFRPALLLFAHPLQNRYSFVALNIQDASVRSPLRSLTCFLAAADQQNVYTKTQLAVTPNLESCFRNQPHLQLRLVCLGCSEPGLCDVTQCHFYVILFPAGLQRIQKLIVLKLQLSSWL